MNYAATPIPGNTHRELLRIDADVTKEFLEAELKKIIGAQKPSMRSNPRYVRTVRRYQAAIAAR